MTIFLFIYSRWRYNKKPMNPDIFKVCQPENTLMHTSKKHFYAICFPIINEKNDKKPTKYLYLNITFLDLIFNQSEKFIIIILNKKKWPASKLNSQFQTKGKNVTILLIPRELTMEIYKGFSSNSPVILKSYLILLKVFNDSTSVQ